MRNKVAKKLRRFAESMTIGMSKEETRKRYQQLKVVHKNRKNASKKRAA